MVINAGWSCIRSESDVMRDRLSVLTDSVASCCLLGVLSMGLALDAAASELGFKGPEIFPLEPRIGALRAADLNQDGFDDLVVINPRRSRIQLLYNQTATLGESVEVSSSEKPEINDLPADARFRIEAIRSERRITSLVVADFTGDARPEIIYCGNQDEVVLMENQGDAVWEETKHWSVPDIAGGSTVLQCGDLNGDGNPQLVVLTEEYFYVIDRKPSLDDSRPRRLLHGGGLRGYQLDDLNSDGADDIMAISSDNEEHVYLRLGGKAGLAASSRLVDIGQQRYVWLDGQLGFEDANLVTIAYRSGEARLSALMREAVPSITEGVSNGELLRIGMPKNDGKQRGLAWADLDGDGDEDLVMADTAAGKLRVHLNEGERGYGVAREYGAYSGIGQIEIADWDGDGQSELFLLSYSERKVGVTEYQSGGGLRFPVPVKLRGRPAGMAVGEVLPGAGPQLAVLERLKEGLKLSLFSPDGTVGHDETLVDIGADRVDLVIHDVDQDGLPDVVPVAAYEELRCLRQIADGGGFERVTIATGARDSEQAWVARVDLDRDGLPELILPQKNAVRGVVLKPSESGDGEKSWSVDVKVQINGAETGSVVGGVASVSSPDADQSVLCLLDVGANQLTFVAGQGDSQWEILDNLELPRADLTQMKVGRDGETGGALLRLVSSDQIYLKRLGGRAWQAKPRGTYETQLESADLWKCRSAALDGVAGNEVVFLEAEKNRVEVVSLRNPGKIELVQRWPVFERRSYRQAQGKTYEPREVVIADLTGDDRPDLALVVHDRILLYPQR